MTQSMSRRFKKSENKAQNQNLPTLFLQVCHQKQSIYFRPFSAVKILPQTKEESRETYIFNRASIGSKYIALYKVHAVVYAGANQD